MSSQNQYMSLFQDFKSSIISRKILTVILLSSSLIFSFFYALMLPNIYRSTAILSATQSKYSSEFEGFDSSTFGSGLSSFLGASAPSGKVSQTDLAIKTLTSRDFFMQLYSDENFLIDVFFKSKFVKKDKSFKIKPSFNSAYKFFYSEVFTVFMDRKTGFIYLNIDHRDPEVAQRIGANVIEKINEYVREDSLTRASKSYNYIKEQLQLTNIVEVRNILSKLAERELQIIILSQSSEDFAFNLVQSPYIPGEKNRPRKSLVAITTFAFLSILSILMIYLLNRYKK